MSKRKWYDISINPEQDLPPEEIVRRGRPAARNECIPRPRPGWFEAQTTEERIAILDQEFKETDSKVLDIGFTKKPDNLWAVPNNETTSYIIPGSDRSIHPFVTCPYCKAVIPYRKLLTRYNSIYNLVSQRKSRLKKKDAELPQIFYDIRAGCRKYQKQLGRTVAQLTSGHRQCFSCGVLLGEGHQENYIEADGLYYCHDCPMDPVEFEKKYADMVKEYNKFYKGT